MSTATTRIRTSEDLESTVPRSHRPRWDRRLLFLVGAIAIFASSCGCTPTFQQGKQYGYHAENATRTNLVVYRDATVGLISVLDGGGVTAVRNVLLSFTPAQHDGFWVCAQYCVYIPDFVAWWKDDVEHRGDLKEALNDARSNRDCFAWTFLPRRNFTHKAHSCKGM